jgi:hypothetical protein
VTDTLQLEDAIQLHDAPKLLVEWSPRWEGFVTSIRPAFGRSGARLAGEAPHGIAPYWGMITALLLEAFFVFVIIVIPKEIDRLRPYAPPRLQPDEVIYYSGDELPRTADLGGGQAGDTGRTRPQTSILQRSSGQPPRLQVHSSARNPSSVKPRSASGRRPALVSYCSQSSCQCNRSGAAGCCPRSLP